MRTITQFLRKQLLWVILVLLVVMVIALYGYTRRARAAPEQPVAFVHQPMVAIGIQCLYCHTDANRSPVAGMPSLEKCMGCHTVINPQNEVIQQVTGYWQRQEAIPWARVNKLPRFVYFSHEVHVAAGLNCEHCHGDVGKMGAAVPVVNMTMGWCLNCHQKQDNTALHDCITCHQ